MSAFQRAERKKAKLRLAICGPAGAGKTMSALLLAKGLVTEPYEGKIALIDTEHASAQLYADTVPFDTAVLEPPYEPAKAVRMMHDAEAAGYQVIILDSITHFWAGEGGLLDKQAAIAKRTGNSYTSWRDITPEHTHFIEAMLGSPCHVIVTMRSKTEYAMTTDDRGKTQVKKLGMAPIQRDGVDYEFSLVFDVDRDTHFATTSKTRFAELDSFSSVISEGTGRQLLQILDRGVEAAPTFDQIITLYRMAKLEDAAIVERIKSVTGKAGRAELIEADLFALKSDALASKAA